MKIILENEVYQKLETWVAMSKGDECSGYGFVRRVGEDLVIYDVILLDINTRTYTALKLDKVGHLVAAAMQRPDAANMKLWFHRHPVGNGIPGAHNWSGTDENTCRNEPFGLPAPQKGWTCSIVRTPHGWVGRVDTYGKSGKTAHLSVETASTSAAGQEFKTIASLTGWTDEVETWTSWKTRKLNLPEGGSRPVQIDEFRSTFGDYDAYPGYDGFDSPLNETRYFVQRSQFSTDDDYLKALALYLDVEVGDLDIDGNGTVWLAGYAVGQTNKKRKKPEKDFFGLWREGIRKRGRR